MDEGEVVLGVLGCPNLPMTSISFHDESPRSETGCLFSAVIGRGSYVELLDGSKWSKVSIYLSIHCGQLSVRENQRGGRILIDMIVSKFVDSF